MNYDKFIEMLVKIVEFPLFTVQKTPITLTSLLMFIILVVFFGLISRLARRLLMRWLGGVTYIQEHTRFLLVRLLQYLIMIFGVLFSLQFVGLDLSGLAFIFGLLSVGIGFGLQSFVGNFIAGLILMVEQPIRVGDRISVGDTEGDVIEINIRSTKVRSLENIAIIVPNADFTSTQVINWSHMDKRIRLQVNVGVAYSSDLDTVIRCLQEVASEHPEVLKSPAPEVFHTGFGDSSWDMRLWCWINNPREVRRIRSDLHCAIVRKFKENAVEIPFPQRDLHVRSAVPIPIEK